MKEVKNPIVIGVNILKSKTYSYSRFTEPTKTTFFIIFSVFVCMFIIPPAFTVASISLTAAKSITAPVDDVPVVSSFKSETANTLDPDIAVTSWYFELPFNTIEEPVEEVVFKKVVLII